MKKTLSIAAATALVAVGLVRLELVAREPAIDDFIVQGTNQLSVDEDPRDPLAQATSAAKEALKKAADRERRVVPEAAGKAFEAFRAAYETDTVTLEGLCYWSGRWLDAEQTAAKTLNERRAALEAYLERTQSIHDKVKALHDAGARGGEAEKYYSMVFYLEEAKKMVRTAGRRTDTEPTKSAQDPSAQSSAKDRSQQPRVSALLQVKYAPTDSRPTDPAEARTYRATQSELLRSPAVLRRALREPGIAQLPIVKEQADPVAWLEKNLVAQYENDSEILRLLLHSGRPNEAAKVVNAVVKAYFHEIVYEAGTRRKVERDKLQAAVNQRDTTISKLRTEKANLAKALGIDENGQNIQIQLLFNEVAALRSQVTTLTTVSASAEVKVMDLEIRLRIEKDPVKKEAYIARELAADRGLQEMKDYREFLETEAVEAEKKSKSPDAGKRRREQMKGVDEQILKRTAKIEEALSKTIIENKATDLQGMLEVAKKEKDIYQEQLKLAKETLEARDKELRAIKVASVDIDNLRETLKQHEALRAKMFADLEAKKLEADAPERVILLENAQSNPNAENGAGPSVPKQPKARFGD